MTKARIIWGLVLLIFPKEIIYELGRVSPTKTWINILRILGIRHLMQYYVVVLHHFDPRYIIGGITLDFSHLLSDVIFIFLNRSRSTLAVIDSLVSVFFIFGDYLDFKKYRYYLSKNIK